LGLVFTDEPSFFLGVPSAMITEAQVREKLSTVKYPGFSRDIVSFGVVKEVRGNG
jgi:ATP-binding protein involved in chromosome partitioning